MKLAYESPSDKWGIEIVDLMGTLLRESPTNFTRPKKQFALLVLLKWYETKERSEQVTPDLHAYYRRFVDAINDPADYLRSPLLDSD